jgi:hypothetical protein
MTPEEVEAWLESLPRRTLAQRMFYWAWRHELEAPPPAQPRPYVVWRKPEDEEEVGWFGWFG